MFQFHSARSCKSVVLIYSTILICLLVGLAGCDSRPSVVELQGKTMGTTYRVKLVVPKNHHLYGDSKQQAKLQNQVDASLQAINQVMSTYIGDSELSRLNQAEANTWIDVSDSLYQILQLSRQISEQSKGAFDITVGPLVNLWGFGPEEREDKVPSQATIDTLLARVGYLKLELDSHQRVRKTADIYVDLSAIAKGFATDLIADDIKQQGMENFMIEIGGELHLAGNNQEGQPWRIGVEQPSILHRGAAQAIGASNVGVATSGDYRNYFEVDGVRFSHTIDPLSGRPITHNLASVTVIASSGAKADAYATAFNVLGPEAGFKLAEDLKLAAYFIVRDGDQFAIKYTPNFATYMVEL